jgi:hypothetical protein
MTQTTTAVPPTTPVVTIAPRAKNVRRKPPGMADKARLLAKKFQNDYLIKGSIDGHFGPCVHVC